MNKIRTYDDLLAEKKQLEAGLIVQRELIRKDLMDLKQEWKPITDVVAKISGNGNTNPIVSMGINIIGDVLLKNVLLGKSGWIVRLIVPFLVKNYATLMNNADGSIIRQLISRFRNRKSNGKQAIEIE